MITKSIRMVTLHFLTNCSICPATSASATPLSRTKRARAAASADDVRCQTVAALTRSVALARSGIESYCVGSRIHGSEHRRLGFIDRGLRESMASSASDSARSASSAATSASALAFFSLAYARALST
jgi:hypothetical protein